MYKYSLVSATKLYLKRSEICALSIKMPVPLSDEETIINLAEMRTFLYCYKYVKTIELSNVSNNK